MYIGMKKIDTTQSDFFNYRINISNVLTPPVDKERFRKAV